MKYKNMQDWYVEQDTTPTEDWDKLINGDYQNFTSYIVRVWHASRTIDRPSCPGLANLERRDMMKKEFPNYEEGSNTAPPL